MHQAMHRELRSVALKTAIRYGGAVRWSRCPDRAAKSKKILTLVEPASAQYEPDVAIDFAQAATALDPTLLEAQASLLGAQLMAADVAAAQVTMRPFDQSLHSAGREDDRYRWRNSFHSGLLKEFRANPYAEEKIARILPLPSLQKIIALAKLIEHEPGYLPASMALLIQCRRHGVPERTGFHRGALHCTSTQSVPMANHPAMRSDIFRLAYLAVRGGVYVDADDLCRHDIGPILAPGFDLIPMREKLASIGDNFTAAAPGHPCIDFILSTIVDLVLERQGNKIWFLTGPGALSMGFCRYYRQQLDRAGHPPACA